MSGIDWTAVPFLAATVAWIAGKRRFLLYALAFILISFAWRLVSSVFIDLRGPLYSVQLFREIGGGSSAPILAAAQVAALLGFIAAFPYKELRRLSVLREQGSSVHGRRAVSIANLVVVSMTLYVVLLFADLVRAGVVPLFAGIERFVYTAEYGGFVHWALMRYGSFLAFYLGLFYAMGILSRGKPDRRFLALLVVVFVYLLLVGHRFSAFYSYGTFFLIPLGACALGRTSVGSKVVLNALPKRVVASSRRVKLDRVVLLALAATLISFGSFRSLLYTRGYDVDAALQALRHRVLVQQGELWWATYERVIVRDEYDPAHALAGIFFEPMVDPSRNTTIPYLMVQEIGDRAFGTLEEGLSYTGGYPEILFELLGPMVAFVGIIVLGYVTGVQLRALIRAILGRRLLRVFLIFYVLYPFLLFHVSGMLNFLVNWKFWLKVGALAIWILYEDGWTRIRLRFGRHELVPSGTGPS